MTTPTTVEELLPILKEARDWAARAVHQSSLEFDPRVHLGIGVFAYGFNTYKCVLLLLPHFYHEQASALLRTLWETCLNLAWVAASPDQRVEQFAGYTIVEYRRFLRNTAEWLRNAGAFEQAADYDVRLAQLEAAAEPQLSRYRQTSGRRQRLASRYSLGSLDQLARELGEPWVGEYHTFYQLACHYAHGAPGAVLFPLVLQAEPNQDEVLAPSRERSVTAGLWAIALLDRLYESFRRFLSVDLPAFPASFSERTGYQRR